VSYQTRNCSSSDGTGCVGAARQNRLCNIQDCYSEIPSFRAQQCAAYNTKKYRGRYFKWVPIKRSAFQCELTCMPKGHNFYVKFASKVADGTKCKDDSLDVCIDGKCEKVGCDLRLNSNAKFDKCMDCNGNNRKCKPIRGTFKLDNFEADYTEMLNIPARTTTITIKEDGPSRNYIALKNYKGDYILNGDWVIQNSGNYKLNGHYAVYKRSSSENLIKINGPIDAPLTIEVLPLTGPVSFSYEYYVPRDMDNAIAQTTYGWSVKNKGECSASCAGGIRKKEIACIASNDGRKVSELLCKNNERPADSEECNTQPCPTHWFVGEWSTCSTSCGTGERVRRVHCIRETKGGQIEMMADAQCKDKKPVRYEKCIIRNVCPQWKSGDWSACSKSCGPGVRTRAVSCIGVSGINSNAVEETNCDMTIKPLLQEPCNLGTCNLTWVIGKWSKCSAHCGKGVRNRQVTCQNLQGSAFPDGYCQRIFKPHGVEECVVKGPCLPMWYTTQWSKCSRECGYGIQIRMIYCAEKDGNSLNILNARSCKREEKPKAMQKCHLKEPCITQYFSSSWKPCSASCGTGLRYRKVRCYADSRIDYSEKSCQSLKRPASVELCNRQPCPGTTNAKAVNKPTARTTQTKKTAQVQTEEQQSTEPKTTEPRTTEPKTTERRTTEPKTTERRTTEPKTTEPRTTEPKTTEQQTTTPTVTTPRTTKATTTTKKVVTQVSTKKAMPPYIINYQGPESIDEGDTVDYYCNALGEPDPEITWTFNGKRVEQLGRRFILLSLQTHLVITSVTKDDSGPLTCQVRNSGGFDSKTLNLRVTSRPTVDLAPAYAKLAEGVSFFMTCDVKSHPEAKITWRKDGRDFIGDSRRVAVTNREIRFKELVQADAGRYECYAENSIGSEAKSMLLVVEPDPQKKKGSTCIDDPDRANCSLIKRYNLCGHPVYSKTCCQTCFPK